VSAHTGCALQRGRNQELLPLRLRFREQPSCELLYSLHGTQSEVSVLTWDSSLSFSFSFSRWLSDSVWCSVCVCVCVCWKVFGGCYEVFLARSKLREECLRLYCHALLLPMRSKTRFHSPQKSPPTAPQAWTPSLTVPRLLLRS
jgi:hypothetical protein